MSVRNSPFFPSVFGTAVDFRKSYVKLSYFKSCYPKVPLLAMTATATPRVQQDVVTQLGLDSCLLFKSSFSRPNITYEVIPKPSNIKKQVDKMAEIVFERFTEKKAGYRIIQCGIIYCFSTKDCESVAESLNEVLKSKLSNSDRRPTLVQHFHAKLDEDMKRTVQQDWTNGKIPIIVATIAFGMGINKPDVRFVIHHSLSKTLEGYLQESGRAGRDGDPASAIVLYNKRDIYNVIYMLRKSAEENKDSNSFEDNGQLELNLQSVYSMADYCEEEWLCRRKMLLEHFKEDFDPQQCGGQDGRHKCDNCKKLRNYQIEWEDLSEPAKIMVKIVRSLPGQSREKIVSFFRGTSLRLKKGERGQNFSNHKLYGIGKKFEMNVGQVHRLLSLMFRSRLLREDYSKEPNGLYFVVVHRLFVREEVAKDLESGRFRITVSKKGNYTKQTTNENRATVNNISVSKQGGKMKDSKKLNSKKSKTAPKQASGQSSRKRSRSLGEQDKALPGDQSQEPMKKMPKPHVPNASAIEEDTSVEDQGVVIDLIDSSDDEKDDTSATLQAKRQEDYRQDVRYEVMLDMLESFNRAALERKGLHRTLFFESERKKIARNPPTNQEILNAMVISGIGESMKRDYGSQLVAAVQQADRFVELVLEGKAVREAFKLDVDAIFGPRSGLVNVNKVSSVQTEKGCTDDEQDWGTDSDDDLQDFETPKKKGKPADQGRMQYFGNTNSSVENSTTLENHKTEHLNNLGAWPKGGT